MSAAVQNEISAESRKLMLSNGRYALVDAEDYGRLKNYHWIQNTVHGKPTAYRRATTGPTTLEQQWKSRKWVVRLRPRLSLGREVMNLPPGDPRRVYYLNGNQLDCRKSNLRVSYGGTINYLPKQNSKKPYQAVIYIDGRHYHLGYYKTRAWAETMLELAGPLAPGLRGKGLTRTQIKRALDLSVGRAVE